MFKNFFVFILFIFFCNVVWADDFTTNHHEGTYVGFELGSDGHGLPVNAFLGHGQLFGETKNYYIAWEASAYMVPERNHVGSMYGLGLSALPGMWLTSSTLGFVRAGLLVSKLDSPNQTHVGDQFGAGVQVRWKPNLDLRAEYIFREYNSIHNEDTSQSIDSHEIDLGLIYRF